MKKIYFTAIALIAFANVYSQEKGKFRVGLDVGYAIPASGGGGVLFSIEPKYNIADNMNVGLRFGAAATGRNVSNASGESDGKVSTNMSYVGTYDYYFTNFGGAIVPYVGAGLGFYTYGDLEFKSNDASLNVDGQFGGLLRAGFEYSKFRAGLEYNMVPKSDIKGISGQDLGTSTNSYFGLHIGFFLGGGKWSK